jgi:hypothetical protein
MSTCNFIGEPRQDAEFDICLERIVARTRWPQTIGIPAGRSLHIGRALSDGGADGEMVVEAAGGRSKAGFGLVIFVEAGAAETFVGILVVFREIETVLDERGASKSVIAYAVAANPRIQERQREQKKKNEQPLRFP